MPEHVTAAVARVQARWPQLDASAQHVAGHAAPVLIEASRTADLVVVGARGRSLVAEVLLGSVSRHVSAQARCPVVVVHGTAPRPTRPVVVGVDGSAASDAALLAAAQEAEALSTGLLVVHAWRDQTYTGYGVYVAPLDLTRELQEAAETATAAQVERALAPDFPDLDVVMRVAQSHPVTALVRASHEAQLVVVGAHGRGRFPGMAQGSVTAGVVHGAGCPVMVMPA
jgi:nucleotide-binding universal stress UspA family protein